MTFSIVSNPDRVANAQCATTNFENPGQCEDSCHAGCGGSALKSTGAAVTDFNPKLTKNVSGTIQIDNIVAYSVLGTLQPGAYIDVMVKFIDKTPVNETCNFGYVIAPELPEISDKACIGSHNIDTYV